MSAPERASPLAGALDPRAHGTSGADAPDTTIALRSGLSLVQVTARRRAGDTVATRLGIDPTPGRASETELGTALWVAPDTWLVVADRREEGDLWRALRALLEDVAAVVDQSHGRATLRLAGPHARDVLAKGCRLDLHPRAFQPGHCAHTTIAHTAVLLHQLDHRPSYDLHLPSSYARAFVDWLKVGAAEFGAGAA